MENLALGSVVVNFGVRAEVVGFFKAADGRPSDHDGAPILQDARGARWVADAAKCEPVDDVCEHGYAQGCRACDPDGGR